jgi:aspartate 1-decarboxylase
MYRQLLKSKIHRAIVTEANLNYVGSITIDEELMEMADIVDNEKVAVFNINNGERFETYAVKGKQGKRQICLNGAAARLVQLGDKIIIVTYCSCNEAEIKNHTPIILQMDENNQVISS